MNKIQPLTRSRIAPRDFLGWVVFVIAVLTTWLVWLHVCGVIEDSARKRFEEIALNQRDLLVDRMKDYEQVLLGASGLFNSSQEVSRQEWREYVTSLHLHLTLPGIQGIGYATVVRPREKAAHEARIRAEGFPNYAISPVGDRDLYTSIIYLEPFSGRNLRAFGYDMYSEPVRHAAMQRAVDTQDVAWSGKVKLVQEDGKGKEQPGFLVYVPIYAKNKPLRTIEERRAALEGFVYSPFRAWDMLGQLYQDPKRLFELQLFDGDPLPENLLFETASPDSAAKFSVVLPIEIGGAHWTARFYSNENFNKLEFSALPQILLIVALSLECVLFLTFVLDARRRREIEATTLVLEQTNREMRLMASLTQLLQNCSSEEEAYPILNRVMADLFPGASGVCYLLNHSETQFVQVSSWGEVLPDLQDFFGPEDCWAYRRGQPHHISGMHPHDVRCMHVPEDVAEYVCMPLQAQGKTIGDLYLQHSRSAPLADAVFHGYIALLASVADTISLSLSNLRLRSSLHDLSIRDSLTGLYNRRYMEENLERELERAGRQGHEVAVVMLDVDYFKVLNDTYGHEAGDTVLKRLADQMKHFRSGSDVACRYGGEEFVLILPEIPEEILCDRLESLRQEIAQMQVISEGRILPSTTVSMGVARYPANATQSAALLRLADEALYQAKRNGRNRIEWVTSDESGDA